MLNAQLIQRVVQILGIRKYRSIWHTPGVGNEVPYFQIILGHYLYYTLVIYDPTRTIYVARNLSMVYITTISTILCCRASCAYYASDVKEYV